MTNAELVARLAENPALYQSLTTIGAGGIAVPPQLSVLRAAAESALQFAIADMLNWTWVRLQLAVVRSTITLADKTTVLAAGVGEILAVTIGTSKRPIDPFWDPKAFTKWLYDYNNTDEVGDPAETDTAERWHVFEHDATTGRLILTFEPGIGSDITADVWYLKPFTAPYSASYIPEHLHGYLFLVALNYAVGFRFDDQVNRIKSLVAARITSAYGALDPVPDDPAILERARIRNATYGTV